VLAWVVLAACAGMALIKEAGSPWWRGWPPVSPKAASRSAALTDSARTVLAGCSSSTPAWFSDLIASPAAASRPRAVSIGGAAAASER
jgi:UPF0716 family protein affecting phage T7 exclusion